MGLPGSGKGTQAFRAAKAQLNFVHFDTGGEIYQRITDPAFEKDARVQKQKEVYFAGLLNDPEWVSELVAECINKYSKMGKSLVFSGSPRTPQEAKALTPLLFSEYGRANVLTLILAVSEETARQRSLGRLVCANKKCRYPTTKDWAGKPCPNCGQNLPMGEQKEESWKTELWGKRLTEYYERTVPAIEYLSRFGFVRIIDGEKSEEEVSRQILDEIALI